MLEIYRLGYLPGPRRPLMMKAGPFKGTVQPDPPVGPKRCANASWAPSTSITIPADWTSGVYLGKLTAERERLQSYVIFVVRDDRKADFLFQVSDTTWNAYNRWPSQFSLYDDGKKEWYWGPNVQTSFDRPYGKYCQILDAPLSVGSGEFLLWEFPLAYWMEQQGYDVTYISNLDTHATRPGLRRAKGWLSVGHDEYWSLTMFQNMQQMVSKDLNLAFLSGNSICGVIDINAAERRPAQPHDRARRPVWLAPEDRARQRFSGRGPVHQERPERGEPDGCAQHLADDRRRRLDLPQARPLALRGLGHEGRRRNSRTGRLGMARRPSVRSPDCSRRQRKNPEFPRRGHCIQRRSTPARRTTSFSTQPPSGGPTGFPSPRAIFGRRSIPDPRARTPACSGSPGTCSTGCADHSRSHAGDAKSNPRKAPPSTPRGEDDPATRAEAVDEPRGIDGRGGYLVQRQDFINPETGAVQLGFQLAPAIKVYAHSSQATIVHLAIAQLSPVQQCPPGLAPKPAPSRAVTKIEPEIMRVNRDSAARPQDCAGLPPVRVAATPGHESFPVS